MNQDAYAAYMGIDWSDRKYDIYLYDDATAVSKSPGLPYLMQQLSRLRVNNFPQPVASEFVSLAARIQPDSD
jgi:hypothetical protein